MQPNLVTSRARRSLGILVAASLVLNVAAQSARATMTAEPSTSAASAVISIVTSSPTELHIEWSSSMIGGTANDPAKYSSPDAALAISLAGMTPVPGAGGPGLSADGTAVTFRYSRPLVPGTYTLQIAEVQDADGSVIASGTSSFSLATSPKLFALIAGPSNPFPPAPGTRPIEDGWEVVITSIEARFGSASTGDIWIDNGVRIAVHGPGDWAIDLVAPRGQSLTPGVYPNATWRFHGPPDQPEIDISGVGTGCSSVGSFEIRDIAFVDDPLFGRKPVRLDASFEARCTTFPSRLFGLVRYSQDTTPPVISANITPTPNADGWNNSPVNVTWNVSDPESGIASSFCFTTNVLTETGFYFVPCSATNGDGLRADASVVVRLDTTRPTITAGSSPAPNAYGWNDAPVDVTFTCADPLSIWGFASGLASCGPDATLDEGSAQTISGQAVDRAGNVTTTELSGINIDLTAPTVVYVGNEGTYEVDDLIAIDCAAQDALSGIATSSCVDVNAPAYLYPLGSHTLSATATDRAGHSSSASTTFTVAVTRGSLCGLTKQFVQTSAKYAALSAAQRAKVDQLMTTVCAHATAMSGTQKHSAVTAYKRGVDALVNLGWLTPSQGVTLKTLATAL